METKEIKLLSVSNAAKEMKIGKARLYQLMDEGRIGWIIIGTKRLIPLSEIVKFIEVSIQYTSTATKVFAWENNQSVSNSTIETDTMELFNKMKENLR